ncbi:neurofilament heavy polypeptide-like [Aphis gossypii]|uniref:neurofilament heavy polypeptide-like n=1 Tax=Aphis gossypii TaxID=80765 RepID=UPI002158DA40|nr:neurofilament heavy polypeptide-like [Aphis gossypii]
MFVDVLKRYLLIVWNFFFGQASTESIKDSPSCPKEQPTDLADVVPPVEVDSNGDNIENREDEDDDIEEIFDDEDEEGEELELEDEDEVEEDEDEKVPIVTKKPEDKVVTKDEPTKPSVPVNKTEEVKVPDVLPKPKDEVKKPEPPKVSEETGEKEKPKVDIDNAKKSEVPAKLKPEFEAYEREEAPPTKPVAPEKDASKFKSSEFEIVEREDKDLPPPKPKAEFENVKGMAVPPPPPPTSTIKSDPATAPDSAKDNTSRPAEVKVDSDDKSALKPAALEKAAAHVKFQEDDDKKTSGKGPVPAVDFATLEKGETVVKPPAATTGNATAGDAVEDFLSAEQTHGGQLLNRHHESIQDQQLDYSDSGEELSDDDIEIDYEDDEDDEEVVEVKPLPPVARSVYKKND